MAEYCAKCMNEVMGFDYKEKQYVLSKEYDLCEGCGEIKPVVISVRKYYYLNKLRFVILPFKFIGLVLYVLFKILTLPYWIYKYNQRNKKVK